MLRRLAALALVLFAACAPQPGDAARPASTRAPRPGAGSRPSTSRSAPSPPESGEAAVVVRAVDGDTLLVSKGGGTDRVRLIGINAPETGAGNRRAPECLGREASDALHRLADGQPVHLVPDVEKRDRYDRMLAYVYRDADGLFLNAQMVADGYASPYTVPPNVAHADELRRLAVEAREAGRGLWSACPGPSTKG